MMRQRTDGFLYFVQAETDPNGPIKIGWSENPWSRLRELQQGCWLPLRIVHLIEIKRGDPGWGTGATSHERWFHERFKRLRLESEWYRFEGELRVVVQKLLAGEVRLRSSA